MTEAFFNQFASHREFQRNINHLLTVNMKAGESLKNHVNYFQSQMALVYNYNEDVAAAAFISGLQVTYPLYKHLVKNDATRMRDILVRAQKYIQIKEATRPTFSRSPKQGPKIEKLKPQFHSKKNLSHNSSAVRKPSRCAAEFDKGGESECDLTPFRIPIDQIINPIKDQPWVRRPAKPSLLTKEGQGLVTTAHSMIGGATSQWTVGPYDDTSKTWSMRDISESSFSIPDYSRRLE